jgi:hypothetical protein
MELSQYCSFTAISVVEGASEARLVPTSAEKFAFTTTVIVFTFLAVPFTTAVSVKIDHWRV